MSEFERRKDQVQEGVQSTAGLIGRVAVIITDAVAAIAREVGDWVTDGIEMNEAARTARRDAGEEGDALDARASDEALDARRAGALDPGTSGARPTGSPHSDARADGPEGTPPAR